MSVPEEIAARSSLEHLRAVFVAGGFERGIGETLGMRGLSAEFGKVVLEGAPTGDHHNPQGTVHGGYLATLLDAAMGLAVQTQLAPGGRFATTNLNVTYLRAVPGDTVLIRAEASVLHSGRSLSYAEAEVVDSSGKVYAHGTATFRVDR